MSYEAEEGRRASRDGKGGITKRSASTARQQNRRTRERSASQAIQRLVRPLEGEGMGFGRDRHFGRKREELLGILAGQVGDRADRRAPSTTIR